MDTAPWYRRIVAMTIIGPRNIVDVPLVLDAWRA
jgi:hypothetical protein